MPLVNVMVNSRAYTIACDEGEQEHLKELAAHVDQKVRELAGSVGQVGDQKLMLMAAVLITDEFFEARSRSDGHAKSSKELASSKADFEARVAAAEKRAADVEKQAARSVEEASKRTTQAVADAEKRIADVEARIAEAMRDAEGKGAQVSEEAEHRAAVELDEAAQRLERIVERLNAA